MPFLIRIDREHIKAAIYIFENPKNESTFNVAISSHKKTSTFKVAVK